MPHFEALKTYSYGKHCEKRRNCLLQAISPFLTMLSTLYGTYLSFWMHFKMLSEICLNLDQSKILSSGNWLKNSDICKNHISQTLLFWPFPKQALVFTYLPYNSFDNTVGKGEIARNEQFLLFPQCFLPIWRTFCHFHQIWNCRL